MMPINNYLIKHDFIKRVIFENKNLYISLIIWNKTGNAYFDTHHHPALFLQENSGQPVS